MPAPATPVAGADENPVVRMLNTIVPDNPLRAAAQGDMLAVMFFSLMVGIGIALSPVDKVEPLVRVLEGLYEVVMQLIELAMRLAPYGVAALLFTLTARFGLAVLKPLFGYMGVVLGGLCIHLLVTYSLLVRYWGGMSPRFFFRQINEVMTTAFSTSSSNATLPTALRVTQEKLGVPRDIASFVLTLGSSANQNGTALFEGVTILFLAQFYGVELTLGSQVLVILFSVLAGIGTAGVPGGSLPMMVPILQSVGVPGEGIGIILGVDRILDMSRTVLNVTGDVTAAVVIAQSEGRLPKTGA
jgi:DAACS family dicarboxylate/amino acid:cation (Na+ or H+) symporter